MRSPIEGGGGGADGKFREEAIQKLLVDLPTRFDVWGGWSDEVDRMEPWLKDESLPRLDERREDLQDKGREREGGWGGKGRDAAATTKASLGGIPDRAVARPSGVALIWREESRGEAVVPMRVGVEGEREKELVDSRMNWCWNKNVMAVVTHSLTWRRRRDEASEGRMRRAGWPGGEGAAHSSECRRQRNSNPVLSSCAGNKSSPARASQSLHQSQSEERIAEDPRELRPESLPGTCVLVYSRSLRSPHPASSERPRRKEGRGRRGAMFTSLSNPILPARPHIWRKEAMESSEFPIVGDRMMTRWAGRLTWEMWGARGEGQGGGESYPCRESGSGAKNRDLSIPEPIFNDLLGVRRGGEKGEGRYLSLLHSEPRVVIGDTIKKTLPQ
jgi:hypothetical protein